MPRFRKLPVEIDAVCWTGANADEVMAIIDFEKLPNLDDGYIGTGIGVCNGVMEIPTLEGVMTAQPGDWIIVGVKGEVYPCKPDIFAATYEEVA